MRVADYVGVIKVKGPRKSSNCIFTEGREINAVKIFNGNAVKIFLCKKKTFSFLLFLFSIALFKNHLLCFYI